MIMNESMEMMKGMKQSERRRDRKSTDVSTNGTSILRSPSDVMSESGNEAGMIYLKDSENCRGNCLNIIKSLNQPNTLQLMSKKELNMILMLKY